MFLLKAGTSNPGDIATRLNRKTTLRARELLGSRLRQRKIHGLYLLRRAKSIDVSLPLGSPEDA
jgi:hypothetical protein